MQSQSSTAAELLQDGTLSVTEIASRLGFSDASSFSQTFKRWFGVAPNNYRKSQAEGVPVELDAIEALRLGWLQRFARDILSRPESPSPCW